MVQPKYSPKEALERVKLMMKYDTSKTLNENKFGYYSKLNEQKPDKLMPGQPDNPTSPTINAGSSTSSPNKYKTLNDLIKDLPNLVNKNEETFVYLTKDILNANGFEIEESNPGTNAVAITAPDNKTKKIFAFNTRSFELLKNFITTNKGTSEISKDTALSNKSDKNKVSQTKEPGVFTTPGDKYLYKVINCVWHTKGGPNNIPTWKSLADKPDAINILDKRYPEGRKNCSAQIDSSNVSQSTTPPPPTSSTVNNQEGEVEYFDVNN